MGESNRNKWCFQSKTFSSFKCLIFHIVIIATTCVLGQTYDLLFHEWGFLTFFFFNQQIQKSLFEALWNIGLQKLHKRNCVTYWIFSIVLYNSSTFTFATKVCTSYRRQSDSCNNCHHFCLDNYSFYIFYAHLHNFSFWYSA